MRGQAARSTGMAGVGSILCYQWTAAHKSIQAVESHPGTSLSPERPRSQQDRLEPAHPQLHLGAGGRGPQRE